MELMFNNKAEEEFLFCHLNKDMTVLEWGSGGSTIAIANRVKEIYSIEHDANWYRKMLRVIQSNVNYYFLKPNKDSNGDGTFDEYKDYITIANTFNKKFDLIFIDGRARLECAKVSVNLLAEGGLIFIHDIFNPNPTCDRPEYYDVLNFLDYKDGVYALHKFTPK